MGEKIFVDSCGCDQRQNGENSKFVPLWIKLEGTESRGTGGIKKVCHKSLFEGSVFSWFFLLPVFMLGIIHFLLTSFHQKFLPPCVE